MRNDLFSIMLSCFTPLLQYISPKSKANNKWPRVEKCPIWQGQGTGLPAAEVFSGPTGHTMCPFKHCRLLVCICVVFFHLLQ